jgi:hypothetical protein
MPLWNVDGLTIVGQGSEWFWGDGPGAAAARGLRVAPEARPRT